RGGGERRRLEREGEGGRLVRPAAVVGVGALLRLALREKVELVEPRRERLHRPVAEQVGPRPAMRLVLLGVVGHVLAEPLLADVAEVRLRPEGHDRRLARELRRHLVDVNLRHDLLDVQGQRAEDVPEAHAASRRRQGRRRDPAVFMASPSVFPAPALRLTRPSLTGRPMVRGVKAVNAAVRFALEMCTLAAFVWWGFATEDGPKALLRGFGVA